MIICLFVWMSVTLVNCNRNFLGSKPHLKQESNVLMKGQILDGKLTKPEIKLRMSLLAKSENTAKLHNGDPNREFNMGLNKFSIMTTTEKQLYLGIENTTLWNTVEPTKLLSLPESTTPSHFNHKKEGHVTPVKSQQYCGSCWSFAGVAAFEGSYAIATGVLKSFSEKEALDCSYPEGKNGCNGGWPTAVWNYIKRSRRLATMRDIPYFPQAESCGKWSGKANGIKNADYIAYYRASSQPANLEKTLSIYTPAVTFAVEDDFYYYRNGLYDGCRTPESIKVNHGGILVGYGPSYWEAKNSWGADWGDDGFVKFTRARDNVCMITSYVVYPVVIRRDRGEHDEPDVIPDDELVNVALNKEVFSSNPESVPQAVDGNIDTCYSTRSSSLPYFKLDLGKISRVQRIEIVTQTDTANQLIGSKVHIGNTGNFVDKRVGIITTVDGRVAVIELEQPVEGSKLYWEYYSGDIRALTVCEIRVFGKDTQEDDGGCPGGTALCSDGICRHVHMC